MLAPRWAPAVCLSVAAPNGLTAENDESGIKFRVLRGRYRTKTTVRVRTRASSKHTHEEDRQSLGAMGEHPRRRRAKLRAVGRRSGLGSVLPGVVYPQGNLRGGFDCLFLIFLCVLPKHKASDGHPKDFCATYLPGFFSSKDGLIALLFPLLLQ